MTATSTPAAAGWDLRSYLDTCRELGRFRHVRGADIEEEIGALSELNARRRPPHSVLFDHIPGYPEQWGVVTGVLASPDVFGTALRLPETTTQGLQSILQQGLVDSWIERAPASLPTPVDLADTPLEQVACGEDLDVLSFPSPQWHPDDGGRYLGTGCLVLTTDRARRWVNAGAYRLMVLDGRRLTLWMATNRHGRQHLDSWWEAGEPCPVVVVPGSHPALLLLAGASMPDGVSELAVAGAMRGEPLPVVNGALTGLPIPAEAEFALEGYIHPERFELEGPFGEATGYYAGGARRVPTIEVEQIYTRENPLILGAAMGKPPFDFEYPFCLFQAALIRRQLQGAGVPGVTGAWVYYARQMIVVALEQQHPGHARQAAYVAAHCGAGAYLARYIIVVDADIDPTNLEEVLWAVATRSDPATDIEIVKRGWGSPIDPMANLFPEGDAYNTRAVIDACVPFTRRADFPKTASAGNERLAQVAAKWNF